MKTLSKESLGEYKDKGSRFIAFAFPCDNLVLFDNKLEQLKKEHFKARHHCYAWRLGFNGEEFRANDDGEPSGTAGIPIYNQLLSFELSNSAIIVVRYFGGTLLGTPGLIKAYKTASLYALEKAELKNLIEKITYNLELNYQKLNEALYLIEKLNLEIIERNFAENANLIIAVEKAQEKIMQESLKNLVIKMDKK